jgi:hypothetical protein
MSHWPIGVIVLLLICLAPTIEAEEPGGNLTREAQNQRLAFMRKTLAEFTFEVNREPPSLLTLPEEPVLKFTNPVRSEVGGATFFLLRQGRPRVV